MPERTEREHPLKAVKRIRITSGMHAGSCKIYDADTGQQLAMPVTNITLAISADPRVGLGLWQAHLTFFPCEFDVEAQVVKRTRKCGNCGNEKELL